VVNEKIEITSLRTLYYSFFFSIRFNYNVKVAFAIRQGVFCGVVTGKGDGAIALP